MYLDDFEEPAGVRRPGNGVAGVHRRPPTGQATVKLPAPVGITLDSEKLKDYAN
ncbi:MULTISPECIES: hypothetical protein [Streptomyces]|uniref:hypothetical protein n=1 Tax=Streptomyces TaxID=1883 RepID=UPI00345B67C4